MSDKLVTTEVDEVFFGMRFKPAQFEVLRRKAQRSGLDRSSYVKLLIGTVDIEAVVGGRLLRNDKEVKKLFKKEIRGLGIAESHALRALSRDYNSILAVNELWLFNKGWVKRLVLQWCDKYDVKLDEFVFTKPIAMVIIKAYFEIEDIVERKVGFTRGRYQLKPNYSMRDVDKLEKKLLVQDAKKFDNLFKEVQRKLNKQDKQALLSFKEELNGATKDTVQPVFTEPEAIIPAEGN